MIVNIHSLAHSHTHMERLTYITPVYTAFPSIFFLLESLAEFNLPIFFSLHNFSLKCIEKDFAIQRVLAELMGASSEDCKWRRQAYFVHALTNTSLMLDINFLKID